MLRRDPAMRKQLALNDVIILLRKRCDEAGTQKAFADASGISPQYIADVLRGKRDPGELVLTALGLQKVITYTEKEAKK